MGENADSGGGVGLSDMDYLRSKVVQNQRQDISIEREKTKEEEEEKEEENGLEDEEEEKANEHCDSVRQSAFTLKMRGLPFSAKEEDVRTFFYPLHLVAVRMPLDSQGRPSGRAFVDFSSSVDLQEALRRNRDCMGSRYIELFADSGPKSGPKVKKEEEEAPRPWEGKVGSGEEEPIAESGRLFVRNLSYSTSEEDLTDLFSKFGPLTELNLLVDKSSSKSIGLAFVSFVFPEHAVRAVEALDGQIYQGRLLHLLPARPRRVKEEEEEERGGASSYKKKKAKEQSSGAVSGHNWNSLFLGANAVMDAMADRYSTEKRDILDPDTSHSLAVRMALGETQLVAETRRFLEENGVKLEVFEQQRPKRSKTVLLIKNLPYNTTTEELREALLPYGSPSRLVLPPHGVTALVEFPSASSARSAFTKLAYTEFKHLPLYLEWAPQDALEERPQTEEGRKETKDRCRVAEKGEERDKEEPGATALASGEQTTIFVKSLNFSTTVDGMKVFFSALPGLRDCSIATKLNMKDPSKPLSMGYGFVEYSTHEQAMRAIKNLQGHDLDGHKLELMLSHRPSTRHTISGKKTAKNTVQKSAKILVRNIPFEATRKEVRQLFSTFGQLKMVRLPQKYGRQQGEHRGFGFVEFITKEDAKRAVEALGHSTHLYGRRLVMEWADEDESVEDIRKRTARYFHSAALPVKKRQRVTEILTSLDTSHSEDEDQ